MATSEVDLPPSSTPFLALVQATQEEKVATWRLNASEFSGRLSTEAYVRREEHLANQSFTREGGITFWILVDERQPPNQRTILSSCETLRKRALVARNKGDGAGDVEQVISHGIASVFANSEYRGRGYGSRMMEELGRKLNAWQQPHGKQTDFTVLYSDIGKLFYAKIGWNAFPSSHVVLPATPQDDINHGPKTNPLKAEHLPKLCAMDEAEIIKRGLVKHSANSGKTMVSLIPDKETLEWHHAREEHFAREMLGGKVPDIKGAYIHCADGSRCWCVWTRIYAKDPAKDTFTILRLAIEGDYDLRAVESADGTSDQTDAPTDEKLAEVAALLRAAQSEASKWDMNEVHLWNPTSVALQATKKIDPSAQLILRGEDSITSLRWHGSEEPGNVEWLGNEKYGWC